MSGEFQHGLFGCFDNTSLCIIGFMATPFVAGKTYEKMGENPILWILGNNFAPCCVGAYMRGMIRRKHGIEGSFMGDCLVHLCIPQCAAIQEAQEVNSMSYMLDGPEPQAMNRTAP